MTTTRLDRIVRGATPVMVVAVFAISVWLLLLVQASIADQAQATQDQTEELANIVQSGRETWQPAVIRIEEKLDAVLEQYNIELENANE